MNAPLAGIPPDRFREQMMQRMLSFNRKEIDQLLTAIRKRRINKDCPPRLLANLAFGHKCRYGCHFGKRGAGISVNEDVYPCHRLAGMEEMRTGNIADYHVDGLNDYHWAAVDSLPECRNCWARYYCGGGCFYFNKAHTGNLHRPEALDCTEKKALFEGFIHLYCQLDDGDKEYVESILSYQLIRLAYLKPEFEQIPVRVQKSHW